MIDVECPGCRAAFPVPDRLGGRLIRCTACREVFRVGGDQPAEDDYGEPRPRRRPRSSSSVLVPLLVVGGILGACLVIAVVVVIYVAGRDNAVNPVVGPRPQAQRRQLPPNAVVPNIILSPARPAGQGGRPAEPVEGPVLVTLSNPRRVETNMPDRRGYQVDYQAQPEAPDENVRYYLVAKVPDGVSEALVHSMLRLADNPQGTLSFAFFPGRDPGQGFELWIERATVGKVRERKRVSAVVTLN